MSAKPTEIVKYSGNMSEKIEVSGLRKPSKLSLILGVVFVEYTSNNLHKSS